jgi:tight adherence protein C
MSFAALAAGVGGGLAAFGAIELVAGLPAGRLWSWPKRRRRTNRSAASLLARLASTVASLGFPRRLVPPEGLRERLTAAGEPPGLGVREWMAIKTGCGACAVLLAASVASRGPGRLGLLLTLAAPLGGFVLPDFWLSRLIRARLEDARRHLPDMLDLLRVAVEAGVPQLRAVLQVSAHFDGALAAEWRRLAASIQLGEPQDAALARLARRLPAEEVRAFVDSLTRAGRHGLPLGKTLAAQAARARHARRQEIRERAARAGPKIQLVVALVLVPSVLLMVAAVLASELVSPGIGFSY